LALALSNSTSTRRTSISFSPVLRGVQISSAMEPALNILKTCFQPETSEAFFTRSQSVAFSKQDILINNNDFIDIYAGKRTPTRDFHVLHIKRCSWRMKNMSVDPVRGVLHTALKGWISFEWALAIYEWAAPRYSRLNSHGMTSVRSNVEFIHDTRFPFV
jgi:hypothetical protein